MYLFPQFLVPPVVPFVAAAVSTGTVTSLPISLQVAIWLALTALVGSALGILRHRTSGSSSRQVQTGGLVRTRHPHLRRV